MRVSSPHQLLVLSGHVQSVGTSMHVCMLLFRKNLNASNLLSIHPQGENSKEILVGTLAVGDKNSVQKPSPKGRA